MRRNHPARHSRKKTARRGSSDGRALLLSVAAAHNFAVLRTLQCKRLGHVNGVPRHPFARSSPGRRAATARGWGVGVTAVGHLARPSTLHIIAAGALGGHRVWCLHPMIIIDL